MLKTILSAEKCADCKHCCKFTKDDIWEIPFITNELKDYISSNIISDYTFEASDGGSVFKMEFMPDGNAYCPMLTDEGCILGDQKPFECQIWPFRVMNKGGKIVLALSKDCSPIQALPPNELIGFISGGFSDRVFAEAEKNPGIVKEYNAGYIELASK